jgi:hypothetical protein
MTDLVEADAGAGLVQLGPLGDGAAAPQDVQQLVVAVPLGVGGAAVLWLVAPLVRGQPDLQEAAGLVAIVHLLHHDRHARAGVSGVREGPQARKCATNGSCSFCALGIGVEWDEGWSATYAFSSTRWHGAGDRSNRQRQRGGPGGGALSRHGCANVVGLLRRRSAVRGEAIACFGRQLAADMPRARALEGGGHDGRAAPNGGLLCQQTCTAPSLVEETPCFPWSPRGSARRPQRS